MIKNLERKPADKVEPKFKVGDTIQPKDRGHEPWQIMQVDISDKKYRFKDGYVIHFSQEDNYELIEQNPAWSEEDENILNNILFHLKDNLKDNEIEFIAYKNWLKSIKDRVQPQSHWKPSDEQMNLLEELVEDNNQRYFYTILRSLYEQLKKLREE